MKHLLTILPILLIFSISSCKKEAYQPPNIIYVLADDLGYGDISAFNKDGKIHTQNIDRLAAEGMKFIDAHTASAVCTPTRYSIITGRYNWRTRLKNGVLTGKSKALIPTSRSTVASMLKQYGYTTAFIGKWHLGWNWALTTDEIGGSGWQADHFDNLDFTKPVSHTPNDLGFDYAYGHSGSLDMAPYVYVENGQITALPNRTTVDTGKYTWWRKGPTGSDFIHEQVTPNFFNRSIDYIKNAATDQPFFLYLALPSPHTPILPLEEWQGKSGINPYADFVLMIDDYIGKMMAALEEKGLAENTMFVFTSDNGCSPEADFEVLGKKGHDPSYIFRGHKADIFEGGHRVPFIVRWPKTVKAGQVSDQVLVSTDLMATAAELVGHTLAANEGEDSYSFIPVLEGRGNSARKEAIHHSINGSFAIRKGDWKLIMAAGSGGWSFPRPGEVAKLDTFPNIQLYNLADDPSETKNLQATENEKVVELTQLLIRRIKEGRSTDGPQQENDPTEGEWKQIDFIED